MENQIRNGHRSYTEIKLPILWLKSPCILIVTSISNRTLNPKLSEVLVFISSKHIYSFGRLAACCQVFDDN